VIEYRFDESPRSIDPDRAGMMEAIRQAQAAAAEDEVPVGAVIFRDGKILAQAHNGREQLRDPTAHAEMLAITQAASSPIGGSKGAPST
jgi:tRNA(adenine34) deaminase